MKKFTILFLLMCFLTVAFSGVAFANADNSPNIKIQQSTDNNEVIKNFKLEQKHSFWVNNRYVIFGILTGLAIYNHNRHHHSNTPTLDPF